MLGVSATALLPTLTVWGFLLIPDARLEVDGVVQCLVLDHLQICVLLCFVDKFETEIETLNIPSY